MSLIRLSKKQIAEINVQRLNTSLTQCVNNDNSSCTDIDNIKDLSLHLQRSQRSFSKKQLDDCQNIVRKLVSKEQQSTHTANAQIVNATPPSSSQRSNTVLAQSSTSKPVAENNYVESTSGERIQTLLQEQKDLSRKDLEEEQSYKASLLEQLAELTAALKETTQDINTTVLEQNQKLDSIQVHATENSIELDAQREKMKNVSKTMTTSIWTTLYLIIVIITLFVSTYVLIRLFPKSNSYYSCPNVFVK